MAIVVYIGRTVLGGILQLCPLGRFLLVVYKYASVLYLRAVLYKRRGVIDVYFILYVYRNIAVPVKRRNTYLLRDSIYAVYCASCIASGNDERSVDSACGVGNFLYGIRFPAALNALCLVKASAFDYFIYQLALTDNAYNYGILGVCRACF